MDPFGRFVENALASLGVPTVEQPWFDGRRGVHRGFDYLEFATHGVMGPLHYAKWMSENHPEALAGFYPVVDARAQRERRRRRRHRRAPGEVQPVPREWYHTDWVAERTIAWLDAAGRRRGLVLLDELPRPAPSRGTHRSPRSARVPWREVPLPGQLSRRRRRARGPARRQGATLARVVRRATGVSNYEAPANWVPATLTADQVREVNALNAVEVELIDEAIGRVLASIDAKGWGDDVDVIFTTDHGEFQGDFGLLFKGPYHVDALMRLPLIWRPAP